MVVFGFSFYQGSFNAVDMPSPGQFGDLKKHRVELPPEESYEYVFHKAGLPRFFLDLRDVQPGPVTDWLLEPRLFRFIGSAYDESRPLDFYSELLLPSIFDVIIYFEDTTPSHLR